MSQQQWAGTVSNSVADCVEAGRRRHDTLNIYALDGGSRHESFTFLLFDSADFSRFLQTVADSFTPSDVMKLDRLWSDVHRRIFYRAMLCIRGTIAMALCLSVCPSVTSRSSTKTAKRRITQTTTQIAQGV